MAFDPNSPLDPNLLAALASGQGAPGPPGAAGDPTLAPVDGLEPPTPQLQPLSGPDFPGLDPQAYQMILGPGMSQGPEGLLGAMPALAQLQEADKQMLRQRHLALLQEMINQLTAPDGASQGAPAPAVGGEGIGF